MFGSKILSIVALAAATTASPMPAAQNTYPVTYSENYKGDTAIGSLNCGTSDYFQKTHTDIKTLGQIPWPHIVAVPMGKDDRSLCGKCIQVTANGKSIYAIAVDSATSFIIVYPDDLNALKPGVLEGARTIPDGTYAAVDQSYCPPTTP